MFDSDYALEPTDLTKIWLNYSVIIVCPRWDHGGKETKLCQMVAMTEYHARIEEPVILPDFQYRSRSFRFGRKKVWPLILCVRRQAFPFVPQRETICRYGLWFNFIAEAKGGESSGQLLREWR